jgi:hypothetical protein
MKNAVEPAHNLASNYPQLTISSSDKKPRLKAPTMYLTQSDDAVGPYYYLVLVAKKDG